jgi:hypothetical protein
MAAVRRLRRALRRRRRRSVPAVLVPRGAPGSARASLFFDRFPRFFETSTTSARRDRLNLRYEAIVGQNADIFPGARVLDIASHDGRWSFAALQAGAAEVTGIEARDDLARAAGETFAHYGVDEGRYRFVVGDVLDVLAREAFQADVVLCLGFLYHTLRYGELMHRIRAVNPRFLVVDTIVLPHERAPVVRIRSESGEAERSAVADAFSHGGRTLVGTPSLRALESILGVYGFEVERYSDWGALLRDNPELTGAGGYARGKRVTARCVSRGR